MIIINKEIKDLLDKHDLIMEMGFKGAISMEEAQEVQLKLQAEIMILRSNQEEK